MDNLAIRAQLCSAIWMRDPKKIREILVEISNCKDINMLESILKMGTINQIFVDVAKIGLFYLVDFPKISKERSVKITTKYKVHKDLIPSFVWEKIQRVKEQKFSNLFFKTKGDFLFIFEDEKISLDEVHEQNRIFQKIKNFPLDPSLN